MEKWENYAVAPFDSLFSHFFPSSLVSVQSDLSLRG
jgi:hypothetical protein